MRATFVSLALAAALLSACSSTPDTAATASSTGGADGQAAGSMGGISSSELGGYGGAGNVQPGTQSDLEVNVGDRVYFAYDSSVIDEAARQTLDRQAQWLEQFPNVQVMIEGHSDERGTREYNLALGERRAAAAKNYLTTLGVSPTRILTISYGEERPADPGHDESAYALNRRAVTVVSVTQ
jgi:peptidoglycan-associated lipoprotein